MLPLSLGQEKKQEAPTTIKTFVTDELGRPLRGGLLHFLRLCLIANNTN